ncbi:MAG: ABC transporter permease, partial [Nocardioides sp.]|nr:ABC transporter permease [Nocardioides sp.]
MSAARPAARETRPPAGRWLREHLVLVLGLLV